MFSFSVITVKMLLIICPLVFLAGLVDAISGGGGLLSLPAYVFAGLPIHSAIATNKLSSSMGTTIATGKYIAKGFVPWRLVPLCVAGAFLGSSLGASLALMVSEQTFKIVLLVVVPFAGFYVLRSKKLRVENETAARQPMGLRPILLSGLISLVVGTYDGFYGPGTGTFLIILLTMFTHLGTQRANGLTKVINWSSNISSLVIYLISGTVLLPLGLISGAFNILGNYIGATLFTKGGSKFIRPFLLLVLCLFYAKLLYELFA